jgi:hypothetical protein
MASYTYAMELTTPESYAAGRLDAGPLPPDVSARIPDVAGLVNYGLLAGEAVGTDIGAAVELLDEVTRSAQIRRETHPDAVRLLSDDDLPLLRDTFATVADDLAAALDPDGRPVGSAGDRLLASEHVDVDALGRAVIGTPRLLVAGLADGLPELARFLDAGVQRRLYVVMD